MNMVMRENKILKEENALLRSQMLKGIGK